MFDSPFIIPVTAMLCGAFVAVGLPIARAYARRLEQAPAVAPDSAARLERMEHALDAVAVEVERISEGQRFTTRLLAEQAGGAPRPGGAHAR